MSNFADLTAAAMREATKTGRLQMANSVLVWAQRHKSAIPGWPMRELIALLEKEIETAQGVDA